MELKKRLKHRNIYIHGFLLLYQEQNNAIYDVFPPWSTKIEPKQW